MMDRHQPSDRRASCADHLARALLHSAEPLSFDLERRVLNHYPCRELPVKLQSTAYTWSQVRGFRRLYAQTRQERPRGLLDD